MTNRELKPVLRGIMVCTVLLVGAARPLQGQEPTQVTLPSVPTGIAVDGQHLWVLDADAKKINQVMITSGKVDRSLNVDVADARGLAFDGQRLWIADGGGNTLIPINVQTGESLEGIKLGESPLGAWDSIEDISWDGKSLWVVCNGGYSSMFNQVDPETGGIMRSVFANCNPRGIATDGKSIWSICYNGDKFPSKIDVRSILPKDHEMQTSRRFLVDIESKAPVGLAIDSNGLLWYADEATSTAYRVRLRDPRGGK